MNKLLSIIIPTYNMESLLPRCLDSILVPKALERLEAIVVNDGSQDDSLTIANQYKYRFPQTVTVINKPNGNYGSTINAGLKIAQGKYIKILDSDDWFSSDALVAFLDALEQTDTDMAVSHFSILHDDGIRELTKYNVYGREPYTYGKVYDLDKVLEDGYIRFFLMHALTYRTSLLRDMGYRQTEGISYTDTQWSCYPIFYAQTITFWNLDLYQYNLARADQTMNPKVLARSLSQLEQMTYDMLTFYGNFDLNKLSTIRRQFLRQYYANRVRILCKCHLIDIPREQFDAKHFTVLYTELMSKVQEFELGNIHLYPENKIIRCDALKYWRLHQRRWPRWFEAFNNLINRVVKWLFVRIFKK